MAIHARDDGSFGRSAGAQTLKGAALIAVALIIGVVLLRTAPKGTTTVSTGGGTPVTRPPARTHGTTTTTPAGPTTTAAATAHSPAQVAVLVANGSGVAGLAGTVRAQLNQAGYNTAKPAANATVSNLTTTEIFYAPGYQPDAAQIATTLGLTNPTVQPISASMPIPSGAQSGVNIVVVAGHDAANGSSTVTTQAPAGVTIPPSGTVQSGSGSATTTTVHHTTTTVAHTAPTTTPTTAAHTTTTR